MAKASSKKEKFPIITPPADRPAVTIEAVENERPPRLSFPIVAMGASAGGLEAFIEFFDAMPPASGIAFVLIQHLPPDRESMLADILGKHTRMPVHEVADGLRIEADNVYVIRPGHTMTIADGVLHLGASVDEPRHRRPVDDFFRSLADEQRERAICVVMSGMGSNGSAGAQIVKAVGGVCIAQEPESAKYPSMPRKLLDLELADYVLRPEEMPEVLLRYTVHPYALGSARHEPASGVERQALGEILTVLRARVRHDFSGYKKPTVFRRVQRRMGLAQLTSMADYARLLRQNPTEVTALADDLMIHVTGFFRDPEAWDALRERVVVPLVADRGEGGSIRGWVSACSSGEEAYTLAMLLVEAAEAAGKTLDIKIFATDTAERSLGHARNGIYPGGIESEISPERLERFFDRDDAVYRVKKALRELVVFAPQNLLQDPPFSRLDICTCRNLLIYLEPEVQRRALALMHFGLRDGGVLLLGNSETITGAEDMFEPIDKRVRLFRRIGPTRHGAVEFPLPHTFTHPTGPEPMAMAPLARASVTQLTQKALLERFSPAAVVIDREQHIVYFHGQTGQFLEQPPGEPTRDLLAQVREFLRGTVRNAVGKAFSENATAIVRDGVIENATGRARIEVTVTPLDPRPAPTHFLVTFVERPEPPAIPLGVAASETTQRQLEEELRRVRDELQSTIEELQTSNEEMKASNEEATSINEELQSTNEELETSKEELQSLNEELTTVNAQLQAKMEELEGTTNDLSSLLSSTDIAVIFLDTHFRIRRFTPAVKDLLELIPSDVGRPLNDLARKFKDDELTADAQGVLDRLVPIQREIASESGRVYVRRILPYRTTDNRIDGVVITFIDITDRKRAESALRESEEQHRLIIEALGEYAIFTLDHEGRIATWNAAAERNLGYAPAEALGQRLDLIIAPKDRDPAHLDELFRQARLESSVAVEGWHARKDGSRFWSSGTLAAVHTPQGELRGFVRILRDNTDRKRHEESLQSAKTVAEAASDAKDSFLANVSQELRAPLSTIVLWARLLEESLGKNPAQAGEALRGIQGSADELRELVEGLVETSRILSGKLRLDLQEVALPAELAAAVARLAPAAAARGVALESQLDPRLDKIVADPARLQQMIANLVTNSLLFAPAGGRVLLAAARDTDSLVLRVTHAGGTAPARPPAGGERVASAELLSGVAGPGGTLRLAITRQLAELHGGRLAPQKDSATGATIFALHLPLKR